MTPGLTASLASTREALLPSRPAVKTKNVCSHGQDSPGSKVPRTVVDLGSTCPPPTPCAQIGPRSWPRTENRCGPNLECCHEEQRPEHSPGGLASIGVIGVRTKDHKPDGAKPRQFTCSEFWERSPNRGGRRGRLPPQARGETPSRLFLPPTQPSDLSCPSSHRLHLCTSAFSFFSFF